MFSEAISTFVMTVGFVVVLITKFSSYTSDKVARVHAGDEDGCQEKPVFISIFVCLTFVAATSICGSGIETPGPNTASLKNCITSSNINSNEIS